ncbi:DUF2252_family protein [Hexamita inflata]|uniref:DUF2252 family protein n=1 Tax=Hexamita inflata TaxID=28002 RepID=A0AA86QSE2_9EUKA|nr:DUF2252 family protein [Hexamita inflata]
MQQDDVITNNDKQSLYQYDKMMTQIYQNKVKDGILTIEDDQKVQSLEFIKKLNVNKLVFQECNNIVPKLESKTIKWLKFYDCDVLSVEDFQLDLEVLEIENHYKKQQSKTIVQEIVRFANISKLYLSRLQINISPISQMIKLTKLVLSDCGLGSVDFLKSLVNLDELCLDLNEVDITSIQYLTKLTILSLRKCNLVSLNALKSLTQLKELYINLNKGVDITSLQFLTKLNILSLRECNLLCLDALRPLLKLRELNIFNNQVIYIQPLTELKSLSKLDARRNNIIDSQTIQQHLNYQKFILSDWEQPTKKQLQTAKILRSFNFQIKSLKTIQKQINYVNTQSNIVKQAISENLLKQYQQHSQFIVKAAFFLQQMDGGYQ